MRSLFHFPFPAQPPLQQPSPTATAPLQPEMCYRPHPAPMRRQRRSPVLLSAARPLPGPALTGPWPTVTRSQGACHAAPPSLPRAAARSHRAPSPEYRPAAARTHWARLVRIAPTACRRPHRIYPTACRHPHPPMSPPSRFRAHRPPSRPSCAAAVLYVLRFAARIAPTVRRHPRHPPPSLSSRCGGPRALAGKNRTVCIPFSPNARKRPPSWQHPPEMHAFRDQDGNILAPCIHSRAQSGDSGCMARESCRQGPFSASGSPKSRMARRCCQRRPAFPRQRHATRGMAERALRPAARAWPACRMRPPCHLACARRGLRSGRTGFAPCSRASPSETRHAVPVPMHLATCEPHPSRQPRAPTASRKQAEQRKQLNAGIKIGSPNGDPIEEFFGFAQRLPDALQPLHQANELALSYLDHSTRQRLGGYVIGLSGNSFTVDLYAALVDHATSIAR